MSLYEEQGFKNRGLVLALPMTEVKWLSFSELWFLLLRNTSNNVSVMEGCCDKRTSPIFEVLGMRVYPEKSNAMLGKLENYSRMRPV